MDTLLIVAFVLVFVLLALLPFVHRAWTSRRGGVDLDEGPPPVPPTPPPETATGVLVEEPPAEELVDEPVAGMTKQETEATAELLIGLAGERSVVVVEHDMEFVRSIARKVTVLHEGSVLAEGNMASVQNDPKVVEVYLGE